MSTSRLEETRRKATKKPELAEAAENPYLLMGETGDMQDAAETDKTKPRLPSAEEVNAEIGRRSLREFINLAWPLVEPDVKFAPGWHIDVLCGVLEKVTAGEISRVIINVPPGTMKSLLVSVIWPAWEWATDPGLRYFTASYGGHLTVRDNLRLRAIITSEWYQKHYKLRLKGDQNEKVRFNTDQGGWRVASSVGGVATGEHPDRIIIDDPLTASQARSDTERTNVNNWFDQTISSRGIGRGVRIVVIMQRLHEEDLSGHLLARGGFEHVRLPMRYEGPSPDGKYRPDLRDPRATPGELLYPRLFPEHVVRQLELDLGPYGTAGQLQQRPAPMGGGLFKREWFKYVDALPVMAIRVRGWDIAATEDGGDYTVGVRIARVGGLFYIEDVKRGKLSSFGVDTLMKDTAQADGIACKQREEREPGSAGKAVVEARARMLVGYDYRAATVNKDKVTRAGPFRSQVEAGNVLLVRGVWNNDYVSELCDFPNGKNDDQVDGSSCAFNAVLLEMYVTITLEPPPLMPCESVWREGSDDSMHNPALLVN